MRPLFFIPSYNDRRGLPEMLVAILGAFPQARVLVVDDGSVPPIALPGLADQHASKAQLIRLESNEGLGLVTGVALDNFLQSDCDFMVRLDADGQHPLGETMGLLLPLQQGLADVTWGERTNHLGLGSTRQLMGSLTKQATAWMGQKIFGSPVRDWYTGFFALNREAAVLAAGVHLERYCEVQLLCVFHSHKLRVATHKVQQLEREHGQSRIQWDDGLMILLRSALTMALYALRMQPR